MHVPIITVEVGSTLTKAHAFDEAGQHLGEGFGLTTVQTGVMAGIREALRRLAERLGALDLTWDRLYANSSAAGGLRMTVHGLTYDMTVRAGREACLGAGAILVKATAGALMETDMREIEALQPNIIFICGGVDHGERTVTLQNAGQLAGLSVRAPVVFAGNQALRSEVESVFARTGQHCVCVENVYPEVDQLNVEPARRVIQQLFAEHIIHAKGMDELAAMAGAPVIPTPAAVLTAGELVYELMGDALIVDIGGATTDVHSITTGSAEYREKALDPEPLAKRTVEGDLGVYVNAAHIAANEGDQPWTGDLKNLRPLPEAEPERKLSLQLAEKALQLAVERHAGKLVHRFSALGRQTCVKGRDLTAIRVMIGTGGALVRLGAGRAMLERIRISHVKNRLWPLESARVLMDEDYLFSAIGTIAAAQRATACRLMEQYLRKLV